MQQGSQTGELPGHSLFLDGVGGLGDSAPSSLQDGVRPFLRRPVRQGQAWCVQKVGAVRDGWSQVCDGWVEP